VSRRRERRTAIGGQFSARLIEMLESPAYAVLSKSAMRVLDRVEIEHAHHGGTDNGRLPVTYNDFVAFGIDRHAVKPGLREVTLLGFLQVTEQGRGGGRCAEFRRPSLYRLTYRHTRDAPPTHEWRRIKTIEQALETAAEARKAARAREAAKLKKKKQKAGGGNPIVPVGGTPTENGPALVGETPITAPVGKPPLPSISRGGERSAPARSAVASSPPALSTSLPIARARQARKEKAGELISAGARKLTATASDIASAAAAASTAPSETVIAELMRTLNCDEAQARAYFASLPDRVVDASAIGPTPRSRRAGGVR